MSTRGSCEKFDADRSWSLSLYKNWTFTNFLLLIYIYIYIYIYLSDSDIETAAFVTCWTVKK